MCVAARYGDTTGPTVFTVRIALARIPATGSSRQRIGSLVWDAGGPGGISTGIVAEMADRMSTQVRKRFDFVASRSARYPENPGRLYAVATSLGQFVQRSILYRSGAPCTTASPMLSAQAIGRALKTTSESQPSWAPTAWRVTSTGSGPLSGPQTHVLGDQLRHPDRLRLRAALPAKVRAMVMDGSIDPTAGFPALPLVRRHEPGRRISVHPRNQRPLYRTVIRTAAQLTAHPIRLNDGRRFTRWNWLDVVGDLIGFQDAWANVPAIAHLVGTARQADSEDSKLGSCWPTT